MQVILSKPVVGLYKDDSGEYQSRRHADEGDLLTVILHNKTHFICDSMYFPETPIAVFPSQCADIITEKEKTEDFAEEKYYNVYEDNEVISYIDKAKSLLNNDTFDPDEF